MKKYMIVLFFLAVNFALAEGVGGITSKGIFEKLQSLNQAREALAGTIDPKGPITEETFRAVCQPVGKELQRWSVENNLRGFQISHKNRNEKHVIPKDLEKSYLDFERNSKLVETVIPYTLDGIKGEMHLYRIQVADSCLACHGEKSARPAFIKEKYLRDRAFDFKSGDLRGVYAVFRPKGK